MGQAAVRTFDVEPSFSTVDLPPETWFRILELEPLSQGNLACCAKAPLSGAVFWRQRQSTLVLSLAAQQVQATHGVGASSLQRWLKQWQGVEEIILARGGQPLNEQMMFLLEGIVTRPPPKLKRLCLRHIAGLNIPCVAALWNICVNRGMELDFRCTDAVAQIVDCASSRLTGGCGLSGCPAAHAAVACARVPVYGRSSRLFPGGSMPPLDELLALQPACRHKVTEELKRLHLPPTPGGVPPSKAVEALLLSYPVALQLGRGTTTLPYVLAIADAPLQLRQAVAAGADLTHQLPNGAHPLFGAAMYGCHSTVDELLQHPSMAGAVDLPNDRGTTPLLVAAMHSRHKVIQRLVEAGADTARKNCEGRSAADVTVGISHPGFCKGPSEFCKGFAGHCLDLRQQHY